MEKRHLRPPGDRRRSHSLPAVYAAHLLALLERWDVGTDELCAGVVAPETFGDPAARLPIPTMVKLIERARTLTAEPGLGVLFGLHMRISTHGYLGFAAMTASTAREALELATRFVPTRTTASCTAARSSRSRSPITTTASSPLVWMRSSDSPPIG